MQLATSPVLRKKFPASAAPVIRLSNLAVVDNPMLVFRRLARESGAEAFLPNSDKQLQSAAEMI